MMSIDSARAKVRYFVRNLDRAISFYTGAFGFEVAERWGPAFAIVRRGGLDLWLSGPDTSAARPMADGRVPEPGGWNRIVIEVDAQSDGADFASFVERLRSDGVTFRNEIVTGPGGSQILAEDPDGNPIEVFQPRE